MKPTAIFNGMIADMREQGHTIDYELAERNTRAALRDQSVEEEEASRLVDGFQPVCVISLDIDLQPSSFSADQKSRTLKTHFLLDGQ